MESLAAGKLSLKGTRICLSSLSRWYLPSVPSCRQYALIATTRRMSAYDRAAAHDRHDSVRGVASSSQAHPLSGYYSLILNSPSPYKARTSTAPSSTTQPEDQTPTPAPAATSKPQTPQEKMAIVFGTRLAGPGRQSRYNPGEAPPEAMWKTINGVPIPPRPEEPDNCCMSGCVHCVWDDFRDEMEDWAGRVNTARAKGGPEKGTADMRTAPRAEVNSASLSMDDDGGGSETNWPVPSQTDDLFASIPVGIREFMKTEKKLRVKHQKEAAA
ncbi:uncharacterized protein N7482_001337 [Penicillium canariense]|uniref:Oxidoreductase-like domain-containing protein n=1 Tax=Penicillium canariense TaxID=189055 RepID=A0A9W9LTG4_9EURO|nr:uncharacterized protein N7482_001337 [Penicillium canariense]KAJ5175460.1 hypothetical protein N7482_001337 [Penicillium canariense]